MPECWRVNANENSLLPCGHPGCCEENGVVNGGHVTLLRLCLSCGLLVLDGEFSAHKAWCRDA